MRIYSNNQSAVTATCTNDYWVFHSDNCTKSATETLYTESLTSGVTYASTGHTCISFNNKFSSADTNIWTTDRLAERYVQRRQCEGDTTAYDRIMSYMTALVYYRDTRMNLYQNIKD